MRFLWILDGDPFAIIEADDPDQAEAILMKKRIDDYGAAFHGDEADAKAEAAYYHDKHDELLSLDGLQVLR